MAADRSPLTALLVHNYYRLPGGEDRVFEAEGRLLEAHGVRVVRYALRNDAVEDMGSVALARATVWNPAAYREVAALVREHRPDVLHAHNTFPLVSPAALAAAHRAGVPVVQTLHNHRLLCANGLLFRAGRTCDACLRTRTHWPALAHRCYRGSLAATAVAVGASHLHRAGRRRVDPVDRYVALTEASRALFVGHGLPADRVVVKPNFVEDRGVRRRGAGTQAVFVGRLSAEKGVGTLLAAWAGRPDLPPLTVVGDGPLRGAVEDAARADARIRPVGWAGREGVDEALADAAFLVAPSECAETFGLTVVEAFAAGVPVLASALGGLAALVEPGATGLTVPPGDAEALGAAAAWLWARRDTDGLAMGAAARARYVRDFTPAANLRQLTAVYAAAGAARGAARAAGWAAVGTDDASASAAAADHTREAPETVLASGPARSW